MRGRRVRGFAIDLIALLVHTGLTMRERRAVTVVKARCLHPGGQATKGRIVDELVELTGWHRDHARRARRQALRLGWSDLARRLSRSTPPMWSPRGLSHTKPGSLLKSQIPISTWADWDDARPGFVEIHLIGHDGGWLVGEHCFTLTVTRHRYRVDAEPDGPQRGPEMGVRHLGPAVGPEHRGVRLDVGPRRIGV